jgi:hypothetical protein
MDLEKQVCTLEQAIKLKELGVKQISLFYHTDNEKWNIMPRKSIDFSGEPYSAYTVAELIQMVENLHNVDYSESNKKYYSQTTVSGSTNLSRFTYYSSFAEACADKLIRSIENQYITVDEVNVRLMR